MLCFNYTGASNPGVDTDSYNGWAEGDIKLTTNISGCKLTNLAAANAICEAQFGTDWQMAEFHQGVKSGWNFYAYGDTQATSRFWLQIDDQEANCWNATP